MRLFFYQIITSDYIYFLSKWFTALSTPGLSAFRSAFADYSPIYLYIIKVLTFLPINSLYSIKTISLLFDIVLAYSAYLILKKQSQKEDQSLAPRKFLAFAVIFSLPTVIVNSSLWGQADSIYASFILLSLFGILDDSPLIATLSFALSLAFKFQAIFFLPIFLGYIFRRIEDLPYLLLIPVVFLATIVPAWLSGGPFSYWLLVYGKQAGEYQGLAISAPSLFAFTKNLSLSPYMSSFLFWAGIIAAALIALTFTVLSLRAANSSPYRVVLMSLACVLLIPYFLPRMHERYFYLADIFSTLIAVYHPKYWFIPVLVVGASLLSYLPYLSQLSLLSAFQGFDLRIPSAMLAIGIAFIVYRLSRLPENSENFNLSSIR